MLNTTIAACYCTPAMRADFDCCAWCEMLGLYSDSYKDAYGIRPRPSHHFEGWTVADFQAAIDSLPKYDAEQEARDHAERRVRTMPLNGSGWCVQFVGEPEVARDRYLGEVGIEPAEIAYWY